MEDRKYYIVKVPTTVSEIQNALDISIGSNLTQKYSADGTEVIIKTTLTRIKAKEDEGIKFDDIFPPSLTTEVTYQEALELMNTEKWNPQLI